MNPILILALLDGAFTLIQKLAPEIRRMTNNGEITVEQQAALQQKIADLSRDDLFSGPEWKAE